MNILQTLTNPDEERYAGYELCFVKREKDADKSKFYKKLYENLKTDKEVPKISTFAEEIVGDMNGEFKDFIKTYYPKSKLDDANTLFEEVTIDKTPDEREDIEKAGRLCTVLMRNVIDKVEQIIDEELKYSHSKISKEIDALMGKDSFKTKFVEQCKEIDRCEIDQEYLELGSQVLIQSGGKFDTSSDSKSNDDNLSSDTIIITVSTKYKDLHCTNNRTLIIDPDEKQKTAYTALWELQHDLIEGLKVDAKISDAYKSAYDKFSTTYPDLKPHLSPEFGFGIGPKPKEVLLEIGPKNNRRVVNGHVFNIKLSMTGFNDNPKRS